MTDITVIIFYLLVLVFSAIIHEVAHGYMAERLGDPTARLAGRLTLNPISHLDPFGSFLLPLLLYFSTGGAFVFGWAKPVPYNPYNLKDPKAGAGKIAAAGPLTNLAIAAVFGVILRAATAGGYGESPLLLLLSIIIYTNVLLAVFNLVPIPPLDGSKVLFALLPRTLRAHELQRFLEQYGFYILIAFVFFGFSFLVPIVQFVYALITGSPFGV